MKRNFKSILAITLVATLTLGTVTVFAEDTKSQSTINDVKIADTVLTQYSTYFLLEDGTLWTNDGEGNFHQVYENVKSISAGDFSDIFMILEDDTLIRGNFYKDYDPSLEEVATDVKSATGRYNDMYILKTDNTVWHSGTDFDSIVVSEEETSVAESAIVTTEAPVEEVAVEETTETDNYNIGVETIVVSPTTTIEASNEFTQIFDNAQKIYSFNGLLFIIDNSNGLWVYGADNYGILTIAPTTPTYIMDNVADVQVNLNEILIKDTSNNLYSVDIPNYNESSESMFDKELNPTLVSTDVEEVEAIDNGYFILKEDGSLWSTGQNSYYNLGFDSYASDELVKVDDMVEAVYSDNASHTIYLKEDGTYWGMGNNSKKQLGTVPYTGENYFDESGKRLIMSDVTDMDLTYDTSAVIKTDDTLWQLGAPFSVEPPLEATVTKIADDVSFVGGEDGISLAYVAGENKDLYFTESYMYLNYLGAEEQEYYLDICLEILESLGYMSDGTDKIEFFESTITNMTEEEATTYKETFDTYIEEKFGSKPVASGVVDFEYLYYLDDNNNLYHLNFNGDDQLVAENVKDFSIWSQEIFVVDTDNNLLYSNLVDSETITVNMSYEEYSKGKNFRAEGITSISAQEEISADGTLTTTITLFRNKDSYDFVDTGLDNIAEANGAFYGFSVLGLDGVLSFYNEANEYMNVEDEKGTPTFKIGDKNYYLRDKIENVKYYFDNQSSFAYITLDDELWVQGSNQSDALGNSDVYGTYIEEPVKIMDDVEKVVLGYNNTLVLTTNKELYGMGQNANGQLGFAPQGYTNKKTTVLLPTKLTLNFVTK